MYSSITLINLTWINQAASDKKQQNKHPVKSFKKRDLSSTNSCLTHAFAFYLLSFVGSQIEQKHVSDNDGCLAKRLEKALLENREQVCFITENITEGSGRVNHETGSTFYNLPTKSKGGLMIRDDLKRTNCFTPKMSDLRVWVDGVERVVRGAHKDTTCENILLALANATGKLGRFALLEKWRDLERILPREAKPIKCLQMWGKQASEVKFVLKLMKDKSTPNATAVARKEFCYDEENTNRDPFHRSFERKSLERVVANQSNKLKRIARDLEIVQLRIDCCVEDDENYLYYTEEEITEDRITKLGQVLKLQAKELTVEETCANELEKERTRLEKLQFELQDQRSKLHHLDVHISDLENVGTKIYSVRAPHESKSDNNTSGVSVNDLEDLAQEIALTRDELTKQRELSDRQIEEVENIKKSFTEIEDISRQKLVQLDALKSESSPSPEPSLSYYDLDKNLQLDVEQDTPLNFVDDKLVLLDKIKLVSPAVSPSPSRNRTQTGLSAPGSVTSRKSARHRIGRFDDVADEPGVFV